MRVTNREQAPFLVIDRRSVEDDRLSWAARGVLAYLLAKPDDWKVRVEDLRKRGDLGRDAIYAVLNELQRWGYLERVRQRNPRGSFGDVDSTLFEVPVPGLPDTARPYPGQPDPAKPRLLSNKYTKEPDNQITTTTTTTDENENGEGCERKLIVPKSLSARERERAKQNLQGLPPQLAQQLAQQLLDELTARLESGAIRGSPLAYLRGMTARARNQDFTPEAGITVAEDRVRREHNESLLERVRAMSPGLPELAPDNQVAQHLKDIRARLNGARRCGGTDKDAAT